MKDTGFIIGILGCLITLVSVVLTSMRAKESNLIASDSLYRDVLLQERKSRIDKLTQEISELLDLISSHNLRMHYENACAFGDKENGVEFNNSMNREISNISSKRVNVLLSMPAKNDEFRLAMAETIQEYADLIDEVKELKSCVMDRFTQLKLNPDLLDETPTLQNLRVYIYENYKHTNKIKKAIGTYNTDYLRFISVANSYLSELRREFEECLDRSNKH